MWINFEYNNVELVYWIECLVVLFIGNYIFLGCVVGVLG